VTAGRKAARAFEQFGYLHPWTLASQLHVADPAITYQALDRDQVPTGTVGIWTSRSATDLRATSFQGQTIELTELNAGSDPRAIGPRLASGLLVNGDFQAPLDSTWMLARGSVATVALDRSALRGHAVLRVAGSGRDGSATTLTQRLLGAPTLPRRLRYRLRLRYRTRALNRPLAIYVKVVHGNGTYQLFGGHDPERPATPGIPSGTARSWRSFEADATVSDPLATIIVVLVDTGTHPLRGTVWIAGPSLEVR
jgi:hypothetical protein